MSLSLSSNREESGRIGTGFRKAGEDLQLNGEGRSLDGSVMHKAGFHPRWFKEEMANERWRNLTDKQRDAFADEIRWRQTLHSGLDRNALRTAAEGRDKGLHKLFGEDQVRTVKAFRIRRNKVRAGPGSDGVVMPSNVPGVMSVTEMSTQLSSVGPDKLPNGQSDPRTSPTAFMAYFGRPPENMPLDPWIGTPREYHAFPDWLRTVPPRYTTSIIMNSVLGYGSWHMDVLCPPEAMTTNTIGTIRWEFNPGMAKRTAFEAPVTVLSHQQSTSKESLIRFGLGIHMELGFWNTDLGRWMFARQVEQLTNAIYLTMIVMIEFKLYHAPKCDDTLEQLLTKPIDERRFFQDLKEEDVRFDAVHKPGGLAGLATVAKKIFRQRGVNGAVHMVMPECVANSWKANGFNKDKDDPAPSVDGVHTTVPLRTDKHGETETSRNIFTHGGFYVLNPGDPAFAAMMKEGTFQSDMIAYARWFDSTGKWEWTTYRDLFRHCHWYNYDLENKTEDREYKANPGESRVMELAATNGRNATEDIGYQILAPGLFNFEAKNREELKSLYDEALAAGVRANEGDANARRAYVESDRKFGFAVVKEFYTQDMQTKVKPFITGKLAAIQTRHRQIASEDDLWNISLATSLFFDICLENNIPILVSMMDLFPHQQRQAQTISFFAKGHGNMYIGYPMAEMSHDGILATAALSLWAYFNAVIDKRSVVNFHLGMPCGYDRGNDRSFWRYEDGALYAKYKLSNIGNEMSASDKFKSRFAVGTLPGYKGPDRSTLDMSGEFNPYYYQGGRNLGGEKRRLHYPTARVYAGFWGWTASVDKQQVHSIDSLGTAVDNTICSTVSVLLPTIAGSPLRYVEGTDLMRHLCFVDAQDVREGRAVPLPNRADQEIGLNRIAFAAGGKLV